MPHSHYLQLNWALSIMETSTVQMIKLAIVATFGLSKDALHIYVGLTVFLVSAMLLKKPLRSIGPWLAVLAIAITGELLDMRDDILSLGHWRYMASMHDIINTLFWPTILMLVARLKKS